MTGGPAPLAVYIHWPFCLSKCPYCDFNSHVRESIDTAAWTEAYTRQIRAYAGRAGPRRIDSIFFGGGTPSLMPPQTAAAIVEAVGEAWSLGPQAEITLEANPAAIDRARFEGFAAAGINRVSIGVQSFDDKALQFLGRTHSSAEAFDAIRLARRLFDRFSFDLIYALPDQTENAWRDEMDQAIGEAGGHLSLYQLTIEQGTAFHTLWQRGDLRVPEEDEAGSLYELTQDVMAGAGLPAYEISNHAAPGHESSHNLIYWRYGDYVGIGPGAHGRFLVDGARHATRHHRAPEVWLDRAVHGQEPMATEQGSEVIGDRDAMTEAVMMGLRTMEGVPYKRLRRLGDGDRTLDSDAVKALIAEGLLEESPTRLRATAAGRQRLNALLAAILK